MDGYFTLKLLMEKRKEFNLETRLAFIDCKKAFDMVSRRKLIQILTENNKPLQVIRAIHDIYSENQILVRTGQLSAWKPINRWVRQGCSLSPLLYIVYMNKIKAEWKKKPHGSIKVDRHTKVDTLLFADDQVLVAESEDDLQRSVCSLHRKAKEYDMEILLDKTKIMAFVRKDHKRSKICIENITRSLHI
jgi:hypothetical protein